ncbi:MAG: DnaJ domain-containing protein [Acidimicrobiia bacterium]
MAAATFYELLGVEHDATHAEIREAYYERARRYHPDAHAQSGTRRRSTAERRMRALNEAWSVLSQPRQREVYDRALSEGTDPTEALRQKAENRALQTATGFRSWLGVCGVIQQGHGRKTKLSLALDGATDLAPLAPLAPNRLHALHATNAPITDDQLIHLAEMESLSVLDLSNTRITDRGLIYLQNLPALEELRLWETGITDAGLAVLGRIRSLRILGLGGTRVTDTGLAHLQGLRDLRVLQLWGTEVEGHGLAALHRLAHLEQVTLPWRVRGRSRRQLRDAVPGVMVA